MSREDVFSAVKIVIAVVGAGIAYGEYNAYRKTERIERAFGYVSTLDASNGVGTSVRKLEDFQRSVLLYKTINPATTKEFMAQAIEADEELQDAALEIARFFDELAVCVATRLCDEDVAKAYLEDRLLSASQFLRPWLFQHSRQYQNSFGDQMFCLNEYFLGPKYHSESYSDNCRF